MRFSSYLPVYFAGISIALICSPVSALSSREVNQIAKGITVRIEDNANKNGSGIIVKQEGGKYYVLTAYHVVNNPERNYTIVTPDGKTHPLNYKTIKRKDGIDLAVAEFQSDRSYKIAKIGDSDKVSEGSFSYVAGFPGKTSVVNAYLYRFKEGKITANANIALDEGYALVYSNNTTGGMSGGPVLNEAGEVIGVHGKEETVGKQGIVVSTGDNLGIPIKTFLTIPLVDVGVRSPKVAVADKPKAADFYLQGLDNNRKKDYPGAVKAYTEAIKLNPKYTAAYNGRGLMYNYQKKYKEALADYNQALKLDPKFAKAYNNRGFLYYEQKKYSQALADYNQAIKLDPKFATAYSSRGVVFQEQKKYPEALADLNQALKLDPKLAGAYNNRGSLYYYQKKYPEALADYNQALKLDPKLAIAYNNRGEIYNEQKNYAKALADFNQALKLDPKLAIAYNGRGSLYYYQKKYAEALADFNQALKLDPDFPTAYNNHGFLYGEQKKYAEALADYNQALKLDPKLAGAYNNRGLLYGQQKKYLQALADLNQALKLDPNYAAAYNNRGFVHYEKADKEAAIKDWRKAISLGDEHPSSLMGLAVGLYSQGERKESFQLAAEALKIDKQRGDLRYLKEKKGWGDVILKDAAKFFQDPQMQK
jgi:tetratricopeptide (TPR) repeat protein